MMQTAMEKRANFDDATTYTSLLYRRKADMECGDPGARANDVQEAEKWLGKATETRRQKSSQAGKKSSE